MNQDYEFLKAVALDPFARNRALHTRGAIRAGASCPADPSVIANGPWAEAECCCDPGPDEFPEVDCLDGGDATLRSRQEQ
jgi:hypothetical protein